MSLSDDLYELASAYLDGDVTDEEAARVEADPELLACVEEIRVLSDAVAAPVPPPSDAAREAAIAAALGASSTSETVRDLSAHAAATPTTTGTTTAGTTTAGMTTGAATPGGGDVMVSNEEARDATVIRPRRWERFSRVGGLVAAAVAGVVVIGLVINGARGGDSFDTASEDFSSAADAGDAVATSSDTADSASDSAMEADGDSAMEADGDTAMEAAGDVAVEPADAVDDATDEDDDAMADDGGTDEAMDEPAEDDARSAAAAAEGDDSADDAADAEAMDEPTEEAADAAEDPADADMETTGEVAADPPAGDSAGLFDDDAAPPVQKFAVELGSVADAAAAAAAIAELDGADRDLLADTGIVVLACPDVIDPYLAEGELRTYGSVLLEDTGRVADVFRHLTETGDVVLLVGSDPCEVVAEVPTPRDS